MVTAPTKEALLHLYSSTLRTSRAFSSYNFRQYFLRRTKTVFREIHVSTVLFAIIVYGDVLTRMHFDRMNGTLRSSLRFTMTK